MNILQSLILGLIEGLTEFLPISSTAHLEIFSKILGVIQSDFSKTFEITIQFGAILAVVFLYFEMLKRNGKVWKRILTAFVPTGIVGFILYKFIKSFLFGNFNIIALALGIGGVIFLVFEYFFKDGNSQNKASEYEIESMPYSKAFIIGLAQALAVIPGVSRSAATIIAGRSLGLSRGAIVEFSFLLAIPTMFAASGYDLLKNASGFSFDQFGVLAIGFIVAFFSALLSVKWLISFIKNHDFRIFGLYRIVLAFLVIFLFW